MVAAAGYTGTSFSSLGGRSHGLIKRAQLNWLKFLNSSHTHIVSYNISEYLLYDLLVHLFAELCIPISSGSFLCRLWMSWQGQSYLRLFWRPCMRCRASKWRSIRFSTAKSEEGGKCNLQVLIRLADIIWESISGFDLRIGNFKILGQVSSLPGTARD